MFKEKEKKKRKKRGQRWFQLFKSENPQPTIIISRGYHVTTPIRPNGLKDSQFSHVRGLFPSLPLTNNLKSNVTLS